MPTYSLTLSLPFREYAGLGLTEPGWLKATMGNHPNCTILWSALHDELVLRRWVARHGLQGRFLNEARWGCLDLAEIQPSSKAEVTAPPP